MADFDSIINVDEWISDYYLTTDDKGSSFGKRVADAFKEWKLQEKDGLPPSTRLTAGRDAIQTALASLSDTSDATQLHEAYDRISAAFGYPPVGRKTVLRGTTELAFEASADKDLTALILRATPLGALEDFPSATLLPLIDETLPTLGDKPMRYGAQKLVGELFLAENAPNFIVILAGNWAVLAERETWPLGRYLAVDVALAIERNDRRVKGEIQRVTAALSFEHLQRGADGTTWWMDTLAEARDHSVKVSEELRGSIKESIEIIGNDVLDRYRAQGLSTADLQGAELGRQALRYLYRILFLLFAEASPELHILPTGDNDYDEGYGLARLRDQILTEPTTIQTQNGTHLYQSLQLLFNLVNKGHDPLDSEVAGFDANATEESLQFRELDADLFSRVQTSYIDRVKLSNLALTKVLQNLLLTKEKRGSDRGFVSYATLGVSELGQVYEGLMSFTGFIAEEDLLEVAKHGDASKGSWVVPEGKAQYLPQDSIISETTETEHGLVEGPRRHKRGSFVFRQSSRDRERSASFYTPPVLTEFTVGQAIEELEASGRISCADDIFTLSICEPAMGSGAFAVEAVNQLAELYLEKKQRELGRDIPGEDRALELQNIKAYIALHQVYGVDLNKTAVELAEISLWLNTMTGELKAPWFGLRLRHGNSLVGATRATFIKKDLNTRAYLTTAPTHHPLTTMAEAIATRERDMVPAGRVHHFLVPSAGWGAAADAKDLKDIAGDEIQAMKTWRRNIQKALTKTQQNRVAELSKQVERLWELSLVRLRIAEDQVRRDLRLFGQEYAPTSKNVMRSVIEEHLFHNPNSAYQRLRLVMDLWNALWYWPVTSTDELPDYEEYLDVLTEILGTPNNALTKKSEGTFGFDMVWSDLDYIEDLERKATGQRDVETIVEENPWVNAAMQIAAEQAFFHWDLDFATVMSQGGFDFQVGNPPWVRPRTDLIALLSELDPWFSLIAKSSQHEIADRKEKLASDEKLLEILSSGLAESVVLAARLSDETQYPYLRGQQPDLYRGFIERTWLNQAKSGVVALIHPESHFTEKRAAPLRTGAYKRLRRHWQFHNWLKLFEVHSNVVYGVHIYAVPYSSPSFLNSVSLYHPETIMSSFNHDGSGPLPGIKNDDFQWDLRPHRARIMQVNESILRVWHTILESATTPVLETRMIYTVNEPSFVSLQKLAEAKKISDLGLSFSSGWHESNDKANGFFDTKWNIPRTWRETILQGSHIGIATPMVKQPNPSMTSQTDLTEIDLEALKDDFLPATSFTPNPNQVGFEKSFGIWDVAGDELSPRDVFRLAWRRRISPANSRSLFTALIPPGGWHINGVITAGPISNFRTVAAAAFTTSFLNDYRLRVSGMTDVYPPAFEELAIGSENILWSHLAKCFLQLNCLTAAYAPLWEMILGEPWTVESRLLRSKERWHVQNEIDAIVALSLQVSLDEFLNIYRTEFPVQRKKDLTDLYDANGRKVAGDVMKKVKKLKEGEELSLADRTWTHPQSQVEYVFEYPFAPLDREADLTAAYGKYAALLEEQQ